jgi:hypothetical protein
MWARSLSWKLVVGTGVGVLALWLLPEWWGSGDLLRAAHRAKNVNAGAPTYADNPAKAVLEDAGDMLTGPLMVGLVAVAVMVMVKRSRPLAWLIAMAIAWLGLVAYMTQDGFSGNQRYLIAPVALLIVLGGAGAGWIVHQALARLGSLGARAAAVAVVAVAVGVGFMVPSFQRLDRTFTGLKWQASLADQLPDLIDRAGGADALKRCGDPYTGPFLVPVVAWNLRLHTKQVQLTPRRPAVVFRVKTTEFTRGASPTLRGIGDAGRTLATSDKWRIVAACG